MTKIYWLMLGYFGSSVIVRLDHPSCFVEGSIMFPMVLFGLSLLLIIMSDLKDRIEG